MVEMGLLLLIRAWSHLRPVIGSDGRIVLSPGAGSIDYFRGGWKYSSAQVRSLLNLFFLTYSFTMRSIPFFAPEPFSTATSTLSR